MTYRTVPFLVVPRQHILFGCTQIQHTYFLTQTAHTFWLYPDSTYFLVVPRQHILFGCTQTAHTFWLYPDSTYFLVVPDICLYVLVLFCKSSTVLYFVGFLQNSNWSTYALRAYTILDIVHTAENSTMQHHATFEIHKF